MKILVATTETQGQRKSDFCFVPEGEIVTFGFECDSDKDNIDGGCGCRRSMVGIDCLRATTTCKVADVRLTKRQYIQKIQASLNKSGFGRIIDTKKEAEELLRIANCFPVGAVVEKRGSVFQVRK
ncbi:hypothetical protein Tfer_2741 [Thermincola ferriacetica]|uniref:DUF7715 domain-containing protein n=1 Tax=Thermincola ferriacetica TaxID=281456 RepID=A0A0L6VZF3_9FIRM|nr:hypothetical protein [Thermincola ferriacetica]KNZ68650.1 hypothetical protein Tfer_2741 [Thermincola ferriacetica]